MKVLPPMLLFVAGCVLTAFWISFLGGFVVRGLAPRWGLIDRPAARKFHKEPTPLGGGIAIWCGVVIPLCAVQGIIWWLQRQGVEESATGFVPAMLREHLPGALSKARQLWSILAAGTVLAGMGLIDDFRPLPWQPRLVVQLLCGALVVASGVRATFFLENFWVGAVISVGWFVIMVNSFNFLDNMDGLSAGIGLICSSVFALMMLRAPGEPRWLVAGYLLILAGSLLGFLCHNWSPARMFMGDTGAYFLGFSIACMTLLGTFYTPAASDSHVMLAPFCVLAIPLYDISSVTWIRLREGRSPFQPDKRHFSHRLVTMGFKPVTAVLTVHLATLTTGLGGLALYAVPDWSSAAIPVAMVVCVVLMIAVLEQTPGPKAVE